MSHSRRKRHKEYHCGICRMEDLGHEYLGRKVPITKHEKLEDVDEKQLESSLDQRPIYFVVDFWTHPPKRLHLGYLRNGRFFGCESYTSSFIWKQLGLEWQACVRICLEDLNEGCPVDEISPHLVVL